MNDSERLEQKSCIIDNIEIKNNEMKIIDNREIQCKNGGIIMGHAVG